MICRAFSTGIISDVIFLTRSRLLKRFTLVSRRTVSR